MPDPAILRCEALEIGYERPILPPIDLSFGPGELWVVLGRNGSGKTTWFRTVLGLVPRLGGQVVRRPGLRVSYVPQRSRFDDLFPLLSRDVVAMGVDRGRRFLGLRLREPDAVRTALEEVGAAELADRPFRELSEGQKQRVLLARLVASGPELAFLDEPTAAMDVVAERAALSLLDAHRRAHGTTVVVVTHYLGAARDIADRALFVDAERQRVVVGAPHEVLGHDAFRHSFGPDEEARADG